MGITVVTPTEHLKHQWAAAAAGFGIGLDSGFRNAHGAASADFHGVAVTYAQVAAHPALHMRRTQARRTLVIFDEIHHAGDALSWGEAIREAFEPARRRLALTGTPFRSDTNPIPFVSYAEDSAGVRRSASDYVYGYGPALADGVVRPVIFLAYSGEMRWRTRAGGELSEFTATLGEPLAPRTSSRKAWRAALDPQGEWVRQVLAAADRRLAEVRRDMPDAAGLVIASDHEDARAYAALLRRYHGSAAGGRAVRRQGRQQAHRGVRQLRRPVDGGGADGVRGCGHPAPGRRRLRHVGQHRAFLRPGGGPVRARTTARGDRVCVRAFGARAARARRRTRGGARPRSYPPRRRRVAGRSDRGGAAAQGHARTCRTGPRSRCCTRRPSSTGWCSTAVSSAPRRRRARRRRRIFSACPACSSRTRWRCSCASARRAS